MIKIKKMRILIYSYNYHPEPIGIAPLMTELAQGLVKRGHEVHVLTAMPWYPEGEIQAPYKNKIYCIEENEGVKIQRSYVWTRRKRSLKNRVLFEMSFALLSFLQGLSSCWRPDIIFVTIPGLPVAVPASILSLLYRAPVILNLQDILPDAAVHVGLLKNPQVIQVFKYLEKFAYWSAHQISVISDGFTKNLMTKGVKAEKIVEIPNWVDLQFIRPLPKNLNQFRHNHDLEKKFVVMYSGNIALTQRMETLVDAAIELLPIENICIVIVSNQGHSSDLQKYAREKQASNVVFIPFQPREKLPEMLAAADVSVILQKGNVIDFNMPSKIQVLLASGRPLIASVPFEGTAAQAIRRSGGGLVSEPEDAPALAKAILWLYEHPQELDLLARQGREYAEQEYCLEKALDNYEKLFRSVLGHSAQITKEQFI